MNGVLAACRRNWDGLPVEVRSAILAYDAEREKTIVPVQKFKVDAEVKHKSGDWTGVVTLYMPAAMARQPEDRYLVRCPAEIAPQGRIWCNESELKDVHAPG